MTKRTILLVDDSPDQLTLLTAQIERSGAFATESFTDARAAIARVESDPPDGVVCDLKMPGIDGLELTRRLHDAYPRLPVIIVTAAGSEEDAASCFEAGASDFVTKPVDPATLVARIRKALDQVPAIEFLEEATRERFDPHGIIGTHPRVKAVRAFVEQVAGVRGASVLLLGESGTGKNLVARAIHAASDSSRFRFVEVNCAALPSHLLEAELFGYERGAFTDARQAKKGLVEEAHGGTLFLDEIGSMPLELQAKLLTFLESRTIRRIGATTERTVELRVVAATNSRLPEMVREGTFREDLYYRLDVASHTLPPLREIRSDVGALARHFARTVARQFGKPEPRIDEAAVRVLEGHDWPGNVRELRNVIERALIFSTGGRLEIVPRMVGDASGSLRSTSGGAHPEGLAPSGEDRSGGRPTVGAPDGGVEAGPRTVAIPVGLTLEDVERLYIQRMLDEVDGHIGDAAERLGVSRKVFWAKRKKLGLI